MISEEELEIQTTFNLDDLEKLADESCKIENIDKEGVQEDEDN